MAKKKVSYFCASCGAEFGKWTGRCDTCGEWNTISEEPVVEHAKKIRTSAGAKAVILAEVSQTSAQRIITPINEFNLVCGGGIVPGSVIIVGGEPGIGKSTLALAIAGTMKSLYVSGEESPSQVRERADRIHADASKIYITTDTDVESIEPLIDEYNPEIIIIDSIQTIQTSDLPSPAGSVTQVRESASRLAVIAKRKNIPLILIGHITKDGSIAGPKILEHIVDTVLYFEGDFTRAYRLLRAFKNRYGSVNETGVFEMTSLGLVEVKDRNAIFLNPSHTESAGSAVSTAIEGTRTILFEVQSLATVTSFSNPRRMADGLDINRLILLAAVLEKHSAIRCSGFDIFLNIAGGFSIAETAADLAVAVSIASSVRNIPLPRRAAFLGELSLSGEIRSVSQADRRVQELVRSGFTQIFMARKDAEECSTQKSGGTIKGVSTIEEVVKFLFE